MRIEISVRGENIVYNTNSENFKIILASVAGEISTLSIEYDKFF